MAYFTHCQCLSPPVARSVVYSFLPSDDSSKWMCRTFCLLCEPHRSICGVNVCNNAFILIQCQRRHLLICSQWSGWVTAFRNTVLYTKIAQFQMDLCGRKIRFVLQLKWWFFSTETCVVFLAQFCTALCALHKENGKLYRFRNSKIPVKTDFGVF